MKVLMMYYTDTNMVGEAKGKVRNASDILASGIQWMSGDTISLAVLQRWGWLGVMEK